jgi:fucose 4-O-acetylase-like acetyltransferase
MAQHSEPIPRGVSDPTERSGGATMRRPGMLTFAAVVMFIVAGFEALSALLAFMGTGWWVTDAGNLVYANFILWGIIDLLIALIALYAGINLLRGGGFGRGMAYVFAIVGAIRWLFVIPAAPILAVVVIALCVMVIYALAKDSDYPQSA